MFCYSLLPRGFVIVILLAAVCACSNSDSSGQLITIDVEAIYNEPVRDMMLSEVVEDIEYYDEKPIKI